MSQTLNKVILLYAHTKGAFHFSSGHLRVRNFSMNKFIKPRNKKYIQPISNNKTHVSSPFSTGVCAWLNDMLISRRASD